MKRNASASRGKPRTPASNEAARHGMEAPQQLFLRLSSVLTAERSLPADLVEIYFERAQETLGPKLDVLLGRFGTSLATGSRDAIDIVREEILASPDHGPVAKVVLLLWYIGGMQNAAGDWEMQSADQYYRALVWDAIGAHPPTLSNGYFGHWKYPVER
jgi:hypothetical protein